MATEPKLLPNCVKDELVLLVDAVLKVMQYSLAVHLMPFSHTRQQLRHQKACATAAAADDECMERVKRAVSRASRIVPGATCLVRALAAKKILERHGCLAIVRMGAKRAADGQLQLHAWLEMGEAEAHETGVDQFRMFRFPNGSEHGEE